MSSLTPSPSSLQRLSVITYNMLAPPWATPKTYPWCDPAHLQWDYRRKLLRSQLLDWCSPCPSASAASTTAASFPGCSSSGSSPPSACAKLPSAQNRTPADLLLLQEVLLDSFEEDFVPTLEQLGFDYVLQTEKRGKTKRGVGLAICFRSSLLRLRYHHSRSRTMFAVLSPVSSPPSDVSAHASHPSAELAATDRADGDDDDHAQPPEQTLNADGDDDDDAQPPTETMTATATATEEDLFVCNVHLDGAPELVDVRFQQTKSLLQRLLAYQQEQGVSPGRSRLVFGGDFNSDHHSSVYRLLSEGRMDAGTTELGRVVTKSEFVHPFQFASAQATAFGREPEFTFVLGEWRSTIDFVLFHRPVLQCVSASPLLHTSSYSLKRRALLEKALPSAELPSDHLPLRCTLAVQVLSSASAASSSPRNGVAR
eukprot:CAMPEP_0177652374 /NCGR_PEP_ID=MMETSP0447-20121125/13087_1 /TAXON_ID=0 /ORGANISM="Stygamoeba regulata, Strain BSH-02190019" /LENGTH=425 /DNA_ID=CAMNT_0019155597 /DNA_START=83 /DNA_END=1360 /DNA_ORIENTATION=+